MFFITAIVTIGFIGFINRWLINKANDQIWDKKFINTFAKTLPYLFVIFGAIWGLGTLTHIHAIKIFGASLTGLILLLNVVLPLTIPFSIGLKKVATLIPKKELKNQSIPENPSRRIFIKTAAAIIPGVAITSVGLGMSTSFSDTSFPQITMRYTNLPDALDGFKILHLSDLHLGYFFGLDHLEKTLLDAEKYNVDMVVVTGDIADDLKIMTDAMNLIGQLKTPNPNIAAVGNHEYFRGIKQSIKKIEAGPIPLLLNKHDIFEVNGVRILIGGADDPVSLSGDKNVFFENALSQTFNNAPKADFKLLMSHRPNALDLGEKFNIDLTLSGHTHGGQVGLFGRSAFEGFSKNAYLWGSYKKGNSQLYTSAGMGHWFPFRLNCPLEAPVITLKKTA